MRSGARPGVLNAIGLAPEAKERNAVPAETAHCTICRAPMEFKLGNYAQTLERCTNAPRCPESSWHAPHPDVDAPEPKYRPHTSRKRRPRSGFVVPGVLFYLGIFAIGVVVGVFAAFVGMMLAPAFIIDRHIGR